MQEQPPPLVDMIRSLLVGQPEWVIAVGAGGLLLLLIIVVVVIIARRRKQPDTRQPPPRLDLAECDLGPPPATPPVLTLYNLPVRLTVLVLAPLGRAKELPAGDAELRQLPDSIVPGLSQIIQTHGTQVRRWDEQLSPRGFANSFFAFANLPGDRGKSSTWCAVAGKVESPHGVFVAGLVLRTEEANSLGQFTVEHAGGWLDILRIRSEA